MIPGVAQVLDVDSGEAAVGSLVVEGVGGGEEAGPDLGAEYTPSCISLKRCISHSPKLISIRRVSRVASGQPQNAARRVQRPSGLVYAASTAPQPSSSALVAAASAGKLSLSGTSL